MRLDGDGWMMVARIALIIKQRPVEVELYFDTGDAIPSARSSVRLRNAIQKIRASRAVVE